MDWTIKSPIADVANFGRLDPVEVLYEYDGPRIFTASSAMGELLCFLADDDGTTLRYIAAPTNHDLLEKLKTGTRALRDVLDQPWVWFVDVRYDGVPIDAWQGTLADAPTDALPHEEVMLWPRTESMQTEYRGQQGMVTLRYAECDACGSEITGDADGRRPRRVPDRYCQKGRA